MTNKTEYDLFKKYSFISQQFTIYVGISLYVVCLCGSIMNMLTLLQRTYHRRACSLYLLTASTCDFIHLNLGLLSNILQYGFHYNWTINSIGYCRTKSYLVCVLTSISATLTMLASIDRYMLSSEKIRRWNYTHRSVGIRYIKLTFIFWIVVSIPIILCYERSYHSSGNEEMICSNSCRHPLCILVQIMYICLFNGFIPPFIMMIFGLLTHNNVCRLEKRSQSKSTRIRRINEQLTLMLILQSIKSTITSIPYSIFNFYWIITMKKPKSLVHQAIENLISQIINLLFWSNYTSFFIYMYSSDIFRHQWIKTMKKIIFCSCKKQRKTSFSSD
jgi:hypothetical protein